MKASHPTSVPVDALLIGCTLDRPALPYRLRTAMLEVLRTIPDVEVLLALEPEKVAAKILLAIRKVGNPDNFHIGNLTAEASANSWGWQGLPPAYAAREKEVSIAVSEAFAWLVAQGLIVPQPGMDGTQGWCRLSRRARQIKSGDDFAEYAKARHLPQHMLHPRIAEKARMAFMRGEYDVAVFQAMKAVEVAVREVSGLSDLIGVALVRQAFRPEIGPLTDTTAEKGEQEARAALFAGAIGSFKNPHSHRDVNLDDATEATEAIMLANHLLRIVDGRRPA